MVLELLLFTAISVQQNENVLYRDDKLAPLKI